MKIPTLRRLIRNTTVPYPDILERVRRAGWRVRWNKAGDVATLTDERGAWAYTLIFENATLGALIKSEYRA